MLIQENFRLQFYDTIRKGHVLIVANTDVDSLCATNILVHIFSCDDVTYTLSPVDSLATLEKTINNHKSQARNIVLVNCVGSNSVMDLGITELPNNVGIFKAIIGEETVRVLVPASEVAEWELPEATAIYSQFNEADSDDSECESQSLNGSIEEADEEGEMTSGDVENEENIGGSRASPPFKRRRDLATAIGKRAFRRQQKVQWERTRKELMWNYYMKSWYAGSVSLLMLELAHELGKCSAETMWCATIGLNSLYIDQLISVETYSELCMDRLRMFIRKYGPRAGVSLSKTRGDDQLRINYDKELTLPLYPHWTLYDSMSNDPFFICQGKLWSQRGEEKFKEMLAQLGITLAESAQNYEMMKKDRRREVFDILEKHMNAGFYSFASHIGYSTNYSACDFVRALSLRLEYKPPKQQLEPNRPIEDDEQLCCERYNAASRILRDFFKLGGRELTSLNRAIESYKLALQSLNELVKRSIVQSHVISASRYFIITIGQQCPALSYFTSRHCLFLFTHSLLRAFASSKTSRRSKPFIVCVPMIGRDIGWFLIVGVMSLAEQLADVSRKSIIGRAFEHVAQVAQIDLCQTFDSNVVMVKSEDRLRFFNHLEARLEIV